MNILCEMNHVVAKSLLSTGETKNVFKKMQIFFAQDIDALTTLWEGERVYLPSSLCPGGKIKFETLKKKKLLKF